MKFHLPPPLRAVLLSCVAAILPTTTQAALVTEELKVMTWNIWHGGHSSNFGDTACQNTLDILKQSNADVILVQETYGSHQSIANHLGYNYVSISDNLSIYSRYEITEKYSFSSPGSFKFGGAAINVNGQEVKVFDTWINWLPDRRLVPVDGTEAEINAWIEEEKKTRGSDLTHILNALEPHIGANASSPVIVGGDFNSHSHLDWTEETKDMYNHGGQVIDFPISNMMLDAGFTDSFREINPDPAANLGSTWMYPHGEEPPKTLTSEEIANRIDYIYYQGDGIDATASEVYYAGMGETLNINGQDLKYYSDHGFVMTTFDISFEEPTNLTYSSGTAATLGADGSVVAGALNVIVDAAYTGAGTEFVLSVADQIDSISSLQIGNDSHISHVSLQELASSTSADLLHIDRLSLKGDSIINIEHDRLASIGSISGTGNATLVLNNANSVVELSGSSGYTGKIDIQAGHLKTTDMTGSLGISMAAGSELTLNAGTNDYTLTGASNLVINGDDTQETTLHIESRTWFLQSSDKLSMKGKVTLDITAGQSLDLEKATVTIDPNAQLTITGGGMMKVNSTKFGGKANYRGAVTIDNGTLYVRDTNAGDVNFSTVTINANGIFEHGDYVNRGSVPTDPALAQQFILNGGIYRHSGNNGGYQDDPVQMASLKINDSAQASRFEFKTSDNYIVDEMTGAGTLSVSQSYSGGEQSILSITKSKEFKGSIDLQSGHVKTAGVTGASLITMAAGSELTLNSGADAYTLTGASNIVINGDKVKDTSINIESHTWFYGASDKLSVTGNATFNIASNQWLDLQQATVTTSADSHITITGGGYFYIKSTKNGGKASFRGDVTIDNGQLWVYDTNEGDVAFNSITINKNGTFQHGDYINRGSEPMDPAVASTFHMNSGTYIHNGNNGGHQNDPVNIKTLNVMDNTDPSSFLFKKADSYVVDALTGSGTIELSKDYAGSAASTMTILDASAFRGTIVGDSSSEGLQLFIDTAENQNLSNATIKNATIKADKALVLENITLDNVIFAGTNKTLIANNINLDLEEGTNLIKSASDDLTFTVTMLEGMQTDANGELTLRAQVSEATMADILANDSEFTIIINGLNDNTWEEEQLKAGLSLSIMLLNGSNSVVMNPSSLAYANHQLTVSSVPASIPEPSSASLSLLALTALLARRRRTKR